MGSIKPYNINSIKRIIASADEYGLSLEKTKCYLIFLGNCTERSKKRIKELFDEICPCIKVEDREYLEILGSSMGASARRNLLNKKMIELQKLSEVVTKLDAHYGFYLLKTALVYLNYYTFFVPALALKRWTSYSSLIPLSANHRPKSAM